MRCIPQIEQLTLRKIQIASKKYKQNGTVYKCSFQYSKAQYELRFRMENNIISLTTMDMYMPKYVLPVMTFNVFLDKKNLQLLNEFSEDIFICNKKMINKPIIVHLRKQLPQLIDDIKNLLIEDVAL